MCGIFFFLGSNNDQDSCYCLPKECIKRRGPNGYQKIQKDLNNEVKLEFVASVLSLRGHYVSQPAEDEKGNILLWNGEIYHDLKLNEEKNDTLNLLQCLGESKTDETILNVFSSIQGPFACIYWQKEQNKLWFGRDVFGRRSLLLRLPNDEHKCLTLSSLSSVSHKKHSCLEVPTMGIFCMSINSFKDDKIRIKYHRRHPQIFSNYPKFSITYDPLPADISNHKFSEEWDEVVKLLGTAVTFSENFCYQKFTPLSWCLPSEADLQTFDNGLADDLIISPNFIPLIEKFIDVLSCSVEVRVCNIPTYCKHCKLEQPNWVHPERLNLHQKDFKCKSISSCSHCKVAVLFSGGIDSTVLALLADKYVPLSEPIDLLNVAFESKNNSNESSRRGKRPSKSSVKDESNSRTYDVPDRITGLDSLKELQNLCPKRKWNFIHIDVTLEDLRQERASSISHLIAPSNTVLDDSIGCALWFAARGSGTLQNGNEKIAYTSPAEIVLIGMGADEQLAGYSRHRVKFQMESWKGLIEELNLEMRRISIRNLGRDDRIISDHGKESRLPFLDEKVVSFLNDLPIWKKANLTLPRGIGEKLLLRLAARHLGLRKAACLPKRAIQFGSRIAKAENVREKGNDVCQRL